MDNSHIITDFVVYKAAAADVPTSKSMTSVLFAVCNWFPSLFALALQYLRFNRRFTVLGH